MSLQYLICFYIFDIQTMQNKWRIDLLYLLYIYYFTKNFYEYTYDEGTIICVMNQQNYWFFKKIAYILTIIITILVISSFLQPNIDTHF